LPRKAIESTTSIVKDLANLSHGDNLKTKIVFAYRMAWHKNSPGNAAQISTGGAFKHSMAPSSDVLWRSQAALLSRWRDDRINDVDGTMASYDVIRRRKESKRAGTPQDAGQISGIDSLPQ